MYTIALQGVAGSVWQVGGSFQGGELLRCIGAGCTVGERPSPWSLLKNVNN